MNITNIIYTILLVITCSPAFSSESEQEEKEAKKLLSKILNLSEEERKNQVQEYERSEEYINEMKFMGIYSDEEEAKTETKEEKKEAENNTDSDSEKELETKEEVNEENIKFTNVLKLSQEDKLNQLLEHARLDRIQTKVMEGLEEKAKELWADNWREKENLWLENYKLVSYALLKGYAQICDRNELCNQSTFADVLKVIQKGKFDISGESHDLTYLINFYKVEDLSPSKTPFYEEKLINLNLKEVKEYIETNTEKRFSQKVVPWGKMNLDEIQWHTPGFWWHPDNGYQIVQKGIFPVENFNWEGVTFPNLVKHFSYYRQHIHQINSLEKLCFSLRNDAFIQIAAQLKMIPNDLMKVTCGACSQHDQLKDIDLKLKKNIDKESQELLETERKKLIKLTSLEHYKSYIIKLEKEIKTCEEHRKDALTECMNIYEERYRQELNESGLLESDIKIHENFEDFLIQLKKSGITSRYLHNLHYGLVTDYFPEIFPEPRQRIVQGGVFQAKCAKKGIFIDEECSVSFFHQLSYGESDDELFDYE